MCCCCSNELHPPPPNIRMKRPRDIFKPTPQRHRYDSSAVAEVDSNATSGELTFEFSEYIGDFTATRPDFTTLAIMHTNPGVASSFPLLSNLASMYETYKFESLNFEFRSLVSPGNQQAAGALMMAFVSNPSAPPLSSKRGMENTRCSASTKVTQNTSVDVPNLRNGQTLYTRTGEVNKQFINTYDIGYLQVATEGCPLGLILGEIWASYTVVLGKLRTPEEQPKSDALPFMMLQTIFGPNENPRSPFGASAGSTIDNSTEIGNIPHESQFVCDGSWTNYSITNTQAPDTTVKAAVTVTLPIKQGQRYVAIFEITGTNLYRPFTPFIRPLTNAVVTSYSNEGNVATYDFIEETTTIGTDHTVNPWDGDTFTMTLSLYYLITFDKRIQDNDTTNGTFTFDRTYEWTDPNNFIDLEAFVSTFTLMEVDGTFTLPGN